MSMAAATCHQGIRLRGDAALVLLMPAGSVLTHCAPFQCHLRSAEYAAGSRIAASRRARQASTAATKLGWTGCRRTQDSPVDPR